MKFLIRAGTKYNRYPIGWEENLHLHAECDLMSDRDVYYDDSEIESPNRDLKIASLKPEHYISFKINHAKFESIEVLWKDVTVI